MATYIYGRETSPNEKVYTSEDYEKLRQELAQTKAENKRLQHEYDSTRGLWCIDRDPQRVDIGWIRRNAFQLTDGGEG